MNKKNIKVVISIVFIVLVILLIGIIVKKVNNTSSQNVNAKAKENMTIETGNSFNKEYDENSESYKTIKEVAEIESNGEVEEIVVTLKNEENNKIEITNKDIEFFKLLASDEKDTDETIKEKVIKNKIYIIEAPKLGITIKKEDIKHIREMVDSNEIASMIPNDENARNNFKERVYNYLLGSQYESALQDKITSEVHNNDISINDKVIKEISQEYHEVRERFKRIENPTEGERRACLNQSALLLNEIKRRYLNSIRDKYTIIEE